MKTGIKRRAVIDDTACGCRCVLHFRLNFNGRIRFGSCFRLCLRCDNPIAGNALHNRRFGVIRAKGITAHEPFAVGDFEHQMFAPLLRHHSIFKDNVNTAPPSCLLTDSKDPPIFSAAEWAIARPIPKLPPLPL